jgi:fumarate hydratase class I
LNSLGDSITMPKSRLVTHDVDARAHFRSEVGAERELLDASLELRERPCIEGLEPDTDTFGAQRKATDPIQLRKRHAQFDACREHSQARETELAQFSGQDRLETGTDVHEGEVGGEGGSVGHGSFRQSFIARRGSKCERESAKSPRKETALLAGFFSESSGFRGMRIGTNVMASPSDFGFTPLLPEGKDETPYRKLTSDYVSTFEAQGQTFLKVEPEALTLLTSTAMAEIAHYLRPGHLAQLRRILDDPEASQNDKFVALDLLKNANIAAKGVLPMCQDTGTAIIMGKKGQLVFTGANDEEAIARGVFDTYRSRNLRYSQLAPLSMYEEVNTKNNLPAQIELFATQGSEYKFLFMAKGGGSANKSHLYQETKALLNPKRLLSFIEEKIASLGTAACPPYHLAIVIGGTSAEHTLKTAKLASARYLDSLPTGGTELGHGYRDLGLEQEVLAITRNLGIGAQFGGKYFCHDVRVIRLPRHGASCPVGIAVSCSADRQALGKITPSGIYIEELEHDPAQYLPDPTHEELGGEVVSVDLNQPMSEIRALLSRYPVKTRLSLTGRLIVARDIAHAKIKDLLDKGQPMPEYMKNHPVYYAGPAKTPEGMPSGSFGPTTAGRMDAYVDEFQSHGGSLIMLAKGNRGPEVTQACKKHGGFYLGSIGGPAARLAEDCIKKVEVLEFPELGMEAVWSIDVVDFPAFIVVDDKGNDFFKMLRPGSLPVSKG